MINADVDRARLAAAEGLEVARSEIEALSAEVDKAPHWLPGRGILAQCGEALTMIEAMRDRMERKLVVSIVGPTGAGKSTLLNALAGVDRLSAVETTRPTTQGVVAFCRDRHDAEPLVSALGQERVRVVSSPTALALEHVVLVDTPDTNSSFLSEHRPIVEAVIGQSDVLICVFNAENPKSRENIDYLAPFVAAFPSEFVLAVLNHCDRQDEQELKTDILGDFEEHLSRSWRRPLAGVYCISARRHLRNPDWPASAQPRHDFDQYPELAETIFGSLNKASLVVDARIRRAEHLSQVVNDAAAERVSQFGQEIEEGRRLTRRLHQSAIAAAVEALESTGSDLTGGADSLLYQRLAQLWWGPVGWLVGLWARLLIVGTGIVNVLRFGNPIRQLWGTVTSLARFSKSKQEMDDASEGEGVEAALIQYQLTAEHLWPNIAEGLVSAGFDPAIRETSSVVARPEVLRRTLIDSWSSAFSTSVEKAARRLSGWGLQLFLNLWVIVPTTAVTIQSIESFVAADVLSGDYFRHALVTIIMIWLLAFVVFQMLVRIWGGSRLIAKTFGRLVQQVTDSFEGAKKGWIVDELDVLKGLARSAITDSSPRNTLQK